MLLLPSGLLIHSQRQLHLDGVRGRYRAAPKETHYHLQVSLKKKKTLKHGRLSNAKESLLSSMFFQGMFKSQ